MLHCSEADLVDLLSGRPAESSNLVDLIAAYTVVVVASWWPCV